MVRGLDNISESYNKFRPIFLSPSPFPHTLICHNPCCMLDHFIFLIFVNHLNLCNPSKQGLVPGRGSFASWLHVSKDSPLGLQIMTSGMSCIDNFNFNLVKNLAEILIEGQVRVYDKCGNSSILCTHEASCHEASKVWPGSPTIVREFPSYQTPQGVTLL